VIVPRLMGDASYTAGAWPFALIVLGLALASPYLPFTHVLLMAARPGWHTVYVLGIFAVNLVALLALIPLFGLPGAGAAIGIAYVSSAVLVRVLARWRVGLRI
jgi:O-antigen/teichoic acid export membrane protein